MQKKQNNLESHLKEGIASKIYEKLTQGMQAISVLYVLCTSSHLILTITLKGKYYFYSHFTLRHEEAE